MKGEPKRQAPECSVLHKLFSFPLSSLPAAPPLFFISLSIPPLHAAVFESVCSGCLVQGAGGEEGRVSLCILPLHTARVARLLIAEVRFGPVTSFSQLLDLFSRAKKDINAIDIWHFIECFINCVIFCGKNVWEIL